MRKNSQCMYINCMYSKTKRKKERRIDLKKSNLRSMDLLIVKTTR